MRPHPAISESGHFSSFHCGLERFQSISGFLNLAPDQFDVFVLLS
jgi:hypothetical protein